MIDRLQQPPHGDLVEQTIYLYDQNYTHREIAKFLSTGSTKIREILKENNIKQRSASDYYFNDTLNTHFFKEINTEENAYFIGLMMADGNVYYSHKGNNTIFRINLQEEDKHILETFKHLVCPTTNLYFCNKKKENIRYKNQYQLFISNEILCNQLISHGCIPNKSLILKYPNISQDEDIQRHFLRGYFDGDGSINYSVMSRKKRTIKEFRFKITSTKNFCDVAKNIIEKFTNVKAVVGLDGKSNEITSSLVIRGGGNYTGLAIEKVMDWLYKDATIYLHRKYNKYLELKEEIKKQRKFQFAKLAANILA